MTVVAEAAAAGQASGPPPFPVTVVGNQGNAGFRLARLLRRRGWRVDLLFLERSGDPRSLPEQVDPSLARDGDPDWLHRYRRERFEPRRLRTLRAWLLARRRPGADRTVDGMRAIAGTRFSQAGAFVAFGREVDFCVGLGRPVVMYPVGSPVTEEPFRIDDPVAVRRRASLRSVSSLITPSQQVYWLGRTLGVPRIVEGSNPTDPEEVRSLADREFLGEFERRCGDCDLVFFAPSRKNLDPAAADYKGPEKIIEAFDVFRSRTDRRVRLVCNLHGRHRQDFEELLGSRSYADDVITWPHMTRPQLFAAFDSPRVIVFDQFPGGAQTVLAGTAREAVAMGAITVCGIDTASRYFRRTYPQGCPVIEAHDTGEIVDAMQRVASLEPEARAALRARTRRWAAEVMERHVDLLAGELRRAHDAAARPAGEGRG